MKYKLTVKIPNSDNITLELDDSLAPKTVSAFLTKIPFSLKANIWGQEIYTDPAPFTASLENAKSLVKLYDVAFWTPGNAICLFYGPTPIGAKGEIKPYSPVNVIGKILNPDANVLTKVSEQKLVFTQS